LAFQGQEIKDQDHRASTKTASSWWSCCHLTWWQCSTQDEAHTEKLHRWNKPMSQGDQLVYPVDVIGQ